MTANSASKAARRFRVQRTDDGIVLVDRQNAEHTVEVRRALVHLTIEARVLRVCRSLVPGGLERWLTLDIVKLSLGSEGDSSDLSVWLEDEDDPYDAENTIFGIDGADLLDLEVTHARVVDLEARGRSGHAYINPSVEAALDSEDSERDCGQHEDDEGHAPVAQLWYHTGEDDSGYRWSALVLTVGFPEPQFSELIDACVSGRADTIVLECGCYANTTGWAFQTARDLILSPGESVTLPIEEATISGPVLTDAPHSLASDNGENGDDAADNDDWDREGNESGPRATAGPGRALLLATVTVCVMAAIFGAGAVLVLTIAVLGAAAALVVTLVSIAEALTHQLRVLSDGLRRKAP